MVKADSWNFKFGFGINTRLMGPSSVTHVAINYGTTNPARYIGQTGGWLRRVYALVCGDGLVADTLEEPLNNMRLMGYNRVQRR
jgi:hypothetical protein